MSESNTGHDWQFDLPALVEASPAAIDVALLQFLQGASSQRITRWFGGVPWLWREYDCCARKHFVGATYFPSPRDNEVPGEFRGPCIMVRTWRSRVGSCPRPMTKWSGIAGGQRRSFRPPSGNKQLPFREKIGSPYYTFDMFLKCTVRRHGTKAGYYAFASTMNLVTTSEVHRYMTNDQCVPGLCISQERIHKHEPLVQEIRTQ